MGKTYDIHVRTTDIATYRLNRPRGQFSKYLEKRRRYQYDFFFFFFCLHCTQKHNLKYKDYNGLFLSLFILWRWDQLAQSQLPPQSHFSVTLHYALLNSLLLSHCIIITKPCHASDALKHYPMLFAPVFIFLQKFHIHVM